METPTLKQRVQKETALLAGLVLVGLALLPFVIYQVGLAVFGAYGGHGYGDFFAKLSEKIRHGDIVAWFLVLSPYVGWQSLRLLAAAWRRSAR